MRSDSPTRSRRFLDAQKKQTRRTMPASAKDNVKRTSRPSYAVVKSGWRRSGLPSVRSSKRLCRPASASWRRRRLGRSRPPKHTPTRSSASAPRRERTRGESRLKSSLLTHRRPAAQWRRHVARSRHAPNTCDARRPATSEGAVQLHRPRESHSRTRRRVSPGLQLPGRGRWSRTDHHRAGCQQSSAG